MKKIKTLLVFGTRPEGIKMCPLVNEMKNNENIDPIVCVTGQHKEMLDSVLEIFNVKPDYDLKVMAHGQTIIDITNKVIKGVDEVIKDCNPDLVLVHGDTTTTFAGSYAAFCNRIPVGHVEAGLRSFDMNSPFPEEANRSLTGTLATYHFAPTTTNRDNLYMENIKENVWVTGNTVIDALFNVIDKNYSFKEEKLNNIDFDNKKIVLLTTHRRENWGKPMENIFSATKRLLQDNKDVEVIFPMHKNPAIRELAYNSFEGLLDRVHLIEPLEYVEFANLMDKVYLIMTDSGGIQEEAPALGKPVIVLRTETERPEAVVSGTIKLAGIEEENIYNIANELLNDNSKYLEMSLTSNPYGNGTSCKQIVDLIVKNINK